MGIGAETARLFAKAGATVVLAARSADRLHALAKEIESQGGSALVVPTDLTQNDQIDRLISTTVEHLGGIDILVNNAAVGLRSFVADIPPQPLESIFALNLFAPIHAIQKALPYLKKSIGGQVINISSIVGLRSIPTLSGYCMTKFALEALSDALRIELRPFNIDVISICPAVTRTLFRDNQFVFGELKPHPPWHTQSAEYVAQRILKASRRRSRRVILTFSARCIIMLNALAPGLMDGVLWFFYKRQLNART